MAYTVTQSPGDYVVGSRQDIIYVVLDDTNPQSASIFKYRYICDIYVGGSRVARLKALPNSANAGVFQVNRVVDDFLTPTRVNTNLVTGGLYRDGLHYLGVSQGQTGKPYSKNLDSLRRIELKFGFEYATSATADPTIFADQITGEYRTFIKAHRKPATSELDSYADGALDEFELSSAVDRFISVAPRISQAPSCLAVTIRYDQNVEIGQSHVVAFLNDSTTSSQTLSPKFMHVTGYQSDGTQLFTGSIENIAANGGEDPTSANSDDERLLYFGIGPLNLTTQTDNTTINTGMDNANLAYYECVMTNSASLLTSQQASAVYRFNITSPCKYVTRRVMFLNQFGGWDFYNFEKKSVKTTDITREGYHRVRGNWDTADGTTDFGYESYDGGRRTNRTTAMTQEVLNSDWVGDEYSDFMRSLVTSNEVYIIEQKSGSDYQLRPVTVEGSSFIHKNSVNDKMVSHSITVKYSNDDLLG